MIVTGASSGIGRALATAAAKNGYRTMLVARRGERLDEVAVAIRDVGGSCATLAADVTAPDAAARIVDATLRVFGQIDVVVNNAGGGAYGALLEQSDAAIEAQWQQHVAAPLRLARAALPYLETTRGQLVFVGSGIARVPMPSYGAYASVKAAIRAAAIQLRRELRARRIAVTYVDPGLVATEFHETMGVERPRRIKAAPPDRIARTILRGISRRAATVNAIPWQTAGTIFGELLATLADPAISRMSPKKLARPDTPRHAEAQTKAETEAKAEPQSLVILSPSKDDSPTIPSSFEKALNPVARRMERVKLSPAFVRDALLPGATLELNELAMRWAGMPNKNERAAMHEVLDALAAAGYLEPTGGETWKVVRAAD